MTNNIFLAVPCHAPFRCSYHVRSRESEARPSTRPHPSVRSHSLQPVAIKDYMPFIYSVVHFLHIMMVFLLELHHLG